MNITLTLFVSAFILSQAYIVIVMVKACNMLIDQHERRQARRVEELIDEIENE